MSNDDSPRTYRYREIERALFHMFDVPDEDAGKFRARIRHLRNLGVPNTPRVGSGTAIAYSRDDVLELVLALQMEAFTAPRFAGDAVKLVLENYRQNMPNISKRPGEDVVVVIVGVAMGSELRTSDLMVCELSRAVEVLRIGKNCPYISFLNLSEVSRRLDRALQ